MSRFFNAKARNGEPVDFWGYRRTPPPQKDVQTPQPKADVPSAPQLDIESLRRQLSSARSKAMARLEESGGKSCLSKERQKPRVPIIITEDELPLVELPGSLPENTPAATPIEQSKNNPIELEIPKRKSSANAPRTVQSPVRAPQHSQPDIHLHPAIQSRPTAVNTKVDHVNSFNNPAVVTRDLSLEESLDLLELEKQFGLSDRRHERKHSKLESVLGVPVPPLNGEEPNKPVFVLAEPSGKAPHRGLPANAYRVKKRSKVESVLGVSLSVLDLDGKKAEYPSKDSKNGDFRSTMEQKRAKHIDLMEVNRALRDAHSIANLNTIIEELQQEVIKRDQVINALSKKQKLRSRYNDFYYTEGSNNGVARDRQPSHSAGSSQSDTLSTADLQSSPDPESPETPVSSYPSYPSSMFEQRDSKGHLDAKSFEPGYNTFMNMSDPGPINRPDVIRDETEMKTPTHPQYFLSPAKYSTRRHDNTDVLPPSAVLKVLDINEQWADIELEHSPVEPDRNGDETVMSQTDTASLTSFTPYPADFSDLEADRSQGRGTEIYWHPADVGIVSAMLESEQQDEMARYSQTSQIEELVKDTTEEESDAKTVGAADTEAVETDAGTAAEEYSRDESVASLEALREDYSSQAESSAEVPTEHSESVASTSQQTTPKIYVEDTEQTSKASSRKSSPAPSRSPSRNSEASGLPTQLPDTHEALYEAIETHLLQSHQRLLELVNEHVADPHAAQIAREALVLESPLLTLKRAGQRILSEAKEEGQEKKEEDDIHSPLSQMSEETYVEALSASSPWSVMNEKFAGGNGVSNQGLGIQL